MTRTHMNRTIKDKNFIFVLAKNLSRCHQEFLLDFVRRRRPFSFKGQFEMADDPVDCLRLFDKKYDISLDCLLYDTTNYFTQMSGETESELSRYAHSKAGKHQLRHVGLALLCNREEGVPLFHRLYSANTHDSKLFSQIQQELFRLLLSLRKGKERMTLVFDKGCNSPENLSEIDKSAFYFIGTLSTYHHPKLCAVPLCDYKEVDYEGKPL